ncbi:MAG TPA: hypothetical protein VGU71_10660 [Candidatus Dormibacteraeota bacterium]|nr:hypothetical protein [Candidatus Dormibacteraeota bacterium]
MPSVATVWRILKRNGLITPQPHKRPRSSFIRFEAKLPNETWQLDSTPWQLADGSPVEILNFLDDKSRVALASTSFPTVKADDVVKVFHSASNTFGLLASLLSDNAAVFTGRSRRGKVLLELELERLGILFKHSTPYHPQTCGKVERFHQTVKRFSACSRQLTPSLSFSFSSIPFAITTTVAAHAELSIARHHSLSSTHSSKPDRASNPRPPTTAFAGTRSTHSAT